MNFVNFEINVGGVWRPAQYLTSRHGAHLVCTDSSWDQFVQYWVTDDGADAGKPWLQRAREVEFILDEDAFTLEQANVEWFFDNDSVSEAESVSSNGWVEIGTLDLTVDFEDNVTSEIVDGEVVHTLGSADARYK